MITGYEIKILANGYLVSPKYHYMTNASGLAKNDYFFKDTKALSDFFANDFTLEQE